MPRGTGGARTHLARLGFVLLASAGAGLSAGCAQLSRTNLSAHADGRPRLGKLVGGNRTEPELAIPGGGSQPEGWTALASDETATARARNAAHAAEAPAPSPAPSRSSAQPPPGAVAALHGAAQPDPSDDAPRPARRTHQPGAFEPTPAPEAQARSESPAPPVEPAAAEPASDLDRIAGLLDQSRDRLAEIQTYSVRMTRQERVQGRLLPQETVVVNVRRQPLGVRLEWPAGGPSPGREVLFSEAECGGLMHVKMGANSILPPMKLAPDSPLAMKNSRHPISEAGFDPILSETSGMLAAVRSGDDRPGVFTYQGETTPEGSSQPCHSIVRTSPEGEKWTLLLDSSTMLPVAVDGRDRSGEILEFYRFDDLQTDVPSLAESSAFDPTVRFASASGGFLGRLAQAAQGAAAPVPAEPPR